MFWRCCNAAILFLYASVVHGWHASSFSDQEGPKCKGVKFNTEPCAALSSTQNSNENSQGRDASQERRAFISGMMIGSIGSVFPRRALASRFKSRTAGYPVARGDDEWRTLLTPRQYDVLRDGATELPFTSVLEGEDRPGTYACAACGTALFDAGQKFHSGTGWPSFGTGLEGVEMEEIKLYQRVNGAEIRCATCGGHLGDTFSDGFLFLGTPAAKSGKRFCVDGSALVFRTKEGEEVIGDEALFPWMKRTF